MNWPKGSQRCGYYIKEEGIYEMLFSSQQSKTKDSRKYYCNAIFPHVQKHLTKNIQKDYQKVNETTKYKLSSMRKSYENVLLEA